MAGVLGDQVSGLTRTIIDWFNILDGMNHDFLSIHVYYTDERFNQLVLPIINDNSHIVNVSRLLHTPLEPYEHVFAGYTQFNSTGGINSLRVNNARLKIAKWPFKLIKPSDIVSPPFNFMVIKDNYRYQSIFSFSFVDNAISDFTGDFCILGNYGIVEWLVKFVLIKDNLVRYECIDLENKTFAYIGIEGGLQIDANSQQLLKLVESRLTIKLELYGINFDKNVISHTLANKLHYHNINYINDHYLKKCKTSDEIPELKEEFCDFHIGNILVQKCEELENKEPSSVEISELKDEEPSSLSNDTSELDLVTEIENLKNKFNSKKKNLLTQIDNQGKLIQTLKNDEKNLILEIQNDYAKKKRQIG